MRRRTTAMFFADMRFPPYPSGLTPRLCGGGTPYAPAFCWALSSSELNREFLQWQTLCPPVRIPKPCHYLVWWVKQMLHRYSCDLTKYLCIVMLVPVIKQWLATEAAEWELDYGLGFPIHDQILGRTIEQH